ncbi:hypothetical protein EUTSA_v10015323mg [Eutrema salsugineum]|uniref:Core Histone H2A/H2B/H3 domain-containing protein n=1 Tax=Eutrema salsugineum TaxID=72664 RepID=V4KZY0_EUTSA|nr:nuclear transcription factor Y subunit C-6 [Eutrema salsugineum]ESQ43540.1 hypothetical protein EUTSA_v10015323mg [Eutrema salsugineum]
MENNNHQPPPQPSQPPMYSQPPHTAAFNPVLQQQNQALKNFWLQQMESVEDFKIHQLPLARIKKIMKSDSDVRMISAEAPIVFAKACEMFIVDLTMRSWLHAEENKRRTLQKPDISAAVARNFAYDFLIDVVPRDESLAAVDPDFVAVPHPDGGGVPYYYPPVIDGSGMYAPYPGQSWPVSWPAVSGDGEEETVQCGENSGGK